MKITDIITESAEAAKAAKAAEQLKTAILADLNGKGESGVAADMQKRYAAVTTPEKAKAYAEYVKRSHTEKGNDGPTEG